MAALHLHAGFYCCPKGVCKEPRNLCPAVCLVFGWSDLPFPNNTHLPFKIVAFYT